MRTSGIAVLVAVVAASSACLLAGGCESSQGPAQAAPMADRPAVVEALPAGAEAEAEPGIGSAGERWGLEVTSVLLSAGGYMIDVRYRVTDPAKAALLLRKDQQSYLLHDRTQARLLVPKSAKVGPLRQTSEDPEAGRVYFAMFANPGGLVKPGDTVTFVLGDMRVDRLTAH